MKKGASHVDWAIGTGIFVIFIILTIIFLSPGLNDTTDNSEILFNSIEEGLNEKAKFTLAKEALIINNLRGANYYRIRLLNPVSNGLNSEWVGNYIHMGIVNSSLDLVKYDLNDENKILTDVLDIETYLQSGENVFWVLYSNEMNYSDPLPVVSITGSPTPEPGTGCFLTGECLFSDEPDHFTYKFGFVENSEGFSLFSLENINNLTEGNPEYERIKEEWGIPLENNFKILIHQLENGLEYSINENGSRSQQKNVYSKVKRDWFLTKEGKLKLAEVIFQIW